MQFEGDMLLPLPRAEAWKKLTDVRFLAQCIREAEKVKEATEDRGVCVIRPGFAFVRGTLELTIQRQEMERETAVTYAMHSKGVGSTSDVESRLTLEDADGQTKVHWVAKVTALGGLLKAVPQGLIRGAAQKTIADVWEGVKEKLTSDP